MLLQGIIRITGRIDSPFFCSTYACISTDTLWMTGWWFGTFFIFPYIGNVIIPTDEFIFFRGVGSTTNQYMIHTQWVIFPSIWVNYNDLTTTSLEIMVSKGNHPQMALIQVSEILWFTQIHTQWVIFPSIHRIGWWENLQESPIFDGKNNGFL